MKKLSDKIAGLPPTKKNKPEIATLKEKLQVLQYDGNYRAALEFVRKTEEIEREARRDMKEKEDEANVMSGALKSKKGAENEAGGVMKVAPQDNQKKERNGFGNSLEINQIPCKAPFVVRGSPLTPTIAAAGQYPSLQCTLTLQTGRCLFPAGGLRAFSLRIHDATHHNDTQRQHTPSRTRAATPN